MKYVYYLDLPGYDALVLKVCNTNDEDLHTDSLNRFGIEFEEDDYTNVEVADNWTEENDVDYLNREYLGGIYSEHCCRNFHIHSWKLVTWDISEETFSFKQADGDYQYLDYETKDWVFDLNELRVDRDNLLKETDITRLDDYPISEEEKNLYAEYREYLRDRPANIDESDPHCLDFDGWKIMYWDPYQ